LGPVRVDLLRQADGARRAPVAELADVPVLAFLLVLLLPVRGNGEDVVAHVDVDIILAHARHRRLDDEFVVLLAHVDRKLGEARLGIPACRGAEPHKVAHGIQHAFHLTERIITPVRYQTGHVYVLLITSTRLIRVYDTIVRKGSAPAPAADDLPAAALHRPEVGLELEPAHHVTPAQQPHKLAALHHRKLPHVAAGELVERLVGGLAGGGEDQIAHRRHDVAHQPLVPLHAWHAPDVVERDHADELALIDDGEGVVVGAHHVLIDKMGDGG